MKREYVVTEKRRNDVVETVGSFNALIRAVSFARGLAESYKSILRRPKNDKNNDVGSIKEIKVYALSVAENKEEVRKAHRENAHAKSIRGYDFTKINESILGCDFKE
jgi:hypothetical protein